MSIDELVAKCREELDETKKMILDMAKTLQDSSFFGVCPVCDHMGYAHYDDCWLSPLLQERTNKKENAS